MRSPSSISEEKQLSLFFHRDLCSLRFWLPLSFIGDHFFLLSKSISYPNQRFVFVVSLRILPEDFRRNLRATIEIVYMLPAGQPSFILFSSFSHFRRWKAFYSGLASRRNVAICAGREWTGPGLGRKLLINKPELIRRKAEWRRGRSILVSFAQNSGVMCYFSIYST